MNKQKQRKNVLRKLLSAILLSNAGIISFSALAAEVPPLGEEPRLEAVSFTQVEISSDFWGPKQATNRLHTIAVNLEQLEKAGNIANFKLAAEGKRTGFNGPLFMDSDLYKGLEAVAYTLATDYNQELDAKLDEIIEIIASAQGEDGYVNTYFTVVKPEERWKNLRDAHELYCAGHMFEAAVAHYNATGKKNFLNIATKFADYIDSVFGDEPGKRAGYAGHPEIELALMKLWKTTGNDRYLKLAQFFTLHRGEKFFAKEHNIPLDKYFGEYHQDQIPIYETKNIMGHAVRAAYLLAGCVDIGRETGDEQLLKMTRRVWNNTVYKNLYITGGIGPSAHNEGFTVDYDLPNDTAYQETCASVAMILFNHRLGLLYGDTKYADVLEQTLYNGFLSGVNLTGDRFFYVNPLANNGTHNRSEWFGCACCPPNVARLMASLGEYLYATNEDSLFVNQFVESTVKTLIDGKTVQMSVVTDYPWEGRVKFIMENEEPVDFNLRVRIPAWSQGNVQVKIPKNTDVNQNDKGYYSCNRTWNKGDTVVFDFAMEPQMIVANPNVKADEGRIALKRGPVVYCLEGLDQEKPLDMIYLPVDTKISSQYRKDLLGGVTVLKAEASFMQMNQNWFRTLYAELPTDKSLRGHTPIVAIPYFAWNNRESSPMEVWIPVNFENKGMSTEGYEGTAKVEMSFVNNNCYPEKIRDGVFPKRSNEHPGQLAHFWPHKGTEEWVSYSWDEPIETDLTRVYWFDDTGFGECRPPVSWVLEYQTEDGQWKEVESTDSYSVELDHWVEVHHKPVKTQRLRIKVQEQPNFSVGFHEWQVIPAE